VTFLNPVAEQMTGWSQDEAVGHPVDEVFALVDDKTGQRRASPVTECMSRGRHYFLDSDVALVLRNGDRSDVRASAAAVRTPQGVVLGAVLVFQDVTDSRAIQRKLAHTAMHDSLTGLPNRAAFERALDEALEQAREEFREHALCFIDIDRFKQVNDSAGHSAGDALLKEIGRAIRGSCRVNDFAGRIGGDEFALLLPDCSLSGARRVAEGVVKAISDLSFTWGGTPYTVGASIGITGVISKSPGPAELMNEADAACYVAKARGRNCVSIYDGSSRGLEQLNRRA
jgi:diguanylate cyclase (GGDEF)-like protein/PAS domain S-box-containing protein